MTLREVIRKVFNKTINEKMTKEQQDAGREAMERICFNLLTGLIITGKINPKQWNILNKKKDLQN